MLNNFRFTLKKAIKDYVIYSKKYPIISPFIFLSKQLNNKTNLKKKN